MCVFNEMCYGIPWYSINEKFGVCYLYTQSNQLEFMYSWHFLKITSTLEWHTQDNMYMYTILYRKSIYIEIIIKQTKSGSTDQYWTFNKDSHCIARISWCVSVSFSVSNFVLVFVSVSVYLSHSTYSKFNSSAHTDVRYVYNIV